MSLRCEITYVFVCKLHGTDEIINPGTFFDKIKNLSEKHVLLRLNDGFISNLFHKWEKIQNILSQNLWFDGEEN